MSKYTFADRHIGPRDAEIKEMLTAISYNSVEQLIADTIPETIRLKSDLNLPKAISENHSIEHIKRLAKKNKNYRSYIGMGYFNTILPGVIQRNILENPGWYTSYTPYQAEISQGRLEALLNFQTMVCDLTAMEIANASLLDEATAGAEAMIMLYNARSREQKKEGANKFFVSEYCYPQTIALLETRAEPLGIELRVGCHKSVKFNEGYFGILLQYPAKYGEVFDYSEIVKSAKDKEIAVAVASDLLSLTI